MSQLKDTLAKLSPEQQAKLRARLQQLEGQQASKGSGRRRRPSIPRHPRGEALPLSYAQQRFFLLQQLEPGTTAYHFPLGLEIHGASRAESWQAALRALVRRHEILRTAFVRQDGEPVQSILSAEEVSVSLARVDLVGLPAERRPEVARQILTLAERPFELFRPPLLRTLWIRLDVRRHWLLVDQHHIITDAWSSGIFLRELCALYGAAATAAPSPLPPPSIQYADYTAWQRDQLTAERRAQQIAWWQHQLAAPTVLQLPTDRPPPAVQNDQGGRVSIRVEPAMVEALETLVQGCGATLFMAVTALFQAFLLRRSGQRDLCLGTPVSQRHPRELEALLGPFLNTVVLRTRLSPDDALAGPPFVDLLRRTRETVLAAWSHQDVPFEEVVSAVAGDHDSSHQTPLFQAMVLLQNIPGEEPTVRGLDLRSLDVSKRRATFDLLLWMRRRDDELSGFLDYRSDLFDPTSAQRLARQLETLLAHVVRQPDCRLGEIPLLRRAERHQLHREWNDQPSQARPFLAMHHQVARQWEERPHTVALADHQGEIGRQLTYGELGRRADALARWLTSHGAGREQVVALLLPRSLELPLAMLAVLRSGAAYLPLDPSYPEGRLSGILDDAQVRLAITTTALAARLPSKGVRVLCQDTFEGCDLPVPQRMLDEPAIDPEQAANVIYTSGSTGRPKGVVLPHRGMAHLISWVVGVYRLAPGKRGSQLVSPGFDAAGQEIWPPLAAGATLSIAPDGVRTLPQDLLRWLALDRIYLTSLPSQLLEVALRHGGWPESLGLLATGGDRLKRAALGDLPAPLINFYGPTENSITSTLHPVVPGDTDPPIGRPTPGVRVHVLDTALREVAVGSGGELHLAGVHLSRGYLKRPARTAESFVPDPFSEEPGGRLYKTGDLVRFRADGELEFLGRRDHQVKVRGYRVELGEIERVLGRHPAVREVVVLARRDGEVERLVAYLVLREAPPTWEALRRFLHESMPAYMVPTAFVVLDELPTTVHGKVERESLPAPDGPGLPREQRGGGGEDETAQRVAALWCSLLGLDAVGHGDNFFDLGGHSMLLLQLHEGLLTAFPETPLSLVDLFQSPTVDALAQRLRPLGEEVAGPGSPSREVAEGRASEVAVIGFAGRFPGSPDVETFWRNLVAGVEGIGRFSSAELLASGMPAGEVEHPDFVPARGVLAEVDRFDAEFFAMTPREAALTDPQQRLFLESAWTALEHAGQDPARFGGSIGVYAGAAISQYWLENLHGNPEIEQTVGAKKAFEANDRDFFATRVSYKLGLTGPSVNVQTACSTSLVAIHQACQSLLAGESDMALAGGVSVGPRTKGGHVYQEGGILSPDGHCRAFDAQARGTVGGDGVAVVVLKRLADARADGDFIHAVVKGSAINNDGAAKLGFFAPGVDGQAAVIRQALERAGLNGRDVDYIEAHGTGTELGDPVEMAGLHQAFGPGIPAGSCALGSVKSNVGHLNTAAGATGFIKAALVLGHGLVPPSLHYERPNPRIDFSLGPFRVADRLLPLPANGRPRRAGVSSFGIGGTNAHAVLEEAPARAEPEPSPREQQLLLLSARSKEALHRATQRLAHHLESHPDLALADVVHTLALGRHAFSHRRIVVARNRAAAVQRLSAPQPGQAPGARVSSTARPALAFLFPGQGPQRVEMSAEIYRSEPTFRQNVDHCAELFTPHLGYDLRAYLFPAPEMMEEAARKLDEIQLALPALFTVEWALAQLLLSWGLEPQALIGYSMGEYVAAAVADVFDLAAAVDLVATRGRLMQGAAPGAMLSVLLPASQVETHLTADLTIGIINEPERCIVSGPSPQIEALQLEFEGREIPCRLLPTDHAYHSAMMDPILDAFAERVRLAGPRAPKIPLVSNLTGTWLTDEEACDVRYWRRQLRHTVRFADGVATLLEEPDRLLLEVGPGQGLTSAARRHVKRAPSTPVLPTLGNAKQELSDAEVLWDTLGRLWLNDCRVDWQAVHGHLNRRRVVLPTYPFERQRHWILPPRDAAPSAAVVAPEPRSGAVESGPMPTAVDSGPAGKSGIAPVLVEQMRLMQEQLRVASQQLAWLRGRGAARGAASGQQVAAQEQVAEVSASRAGEGSSPEAAPGVTAFPATAPSSAVASAPASPRPESIEAPPENEGAPLPLTPIQSWLLRHRRAPHHFNISKFVGLCPALEPPRVEAALNVLVAHHAALRLSFQRDATGGFVQTCAVRAPAVAVPEIDLTGLASEYRAAAQETAASTLQSSIDLASGLLLRTALFRPDGGSRRLLVIVHHLAMDITSWQIFMSDLNLLCGQLLAGQPLLLPAATTSFPQWTRRLAEYATSDDLALEAARWRQLSRRFAPRLPLDHPGGENTIASARQLSMRLDRTITHQLERGLPTTYGGAQLLDAVLAAVARSLAAWIGARPVLVDLEGHGREDLFEDVDLSRTVGWFTCIYPFFLDPGGGDDLGRAVQRVWNERQALPQGGIGHGVLAQMSSAEQLRRQLQGLGAEVTFNYLGRHRSTLPDARPSDAAVWELNQPVGAVRALRGQRPYLLEIDALVDQGELCLHWRYSEHLHRGATVERLAERTLDSLRRLADSHLPAAALHEGTEPASCEILDTPRRFDPSTSTRGALLP